MMDQSQPIKQKASTILWGRRGSGGSKVGQHTWRFPRGSLGRWRVYVLGQMVRQAVSACARALDDANDDVVDERRAVHQPPNNGSSANNCGGAQKSEARRGCMNQL